MSDFRLSPEVLSLLAAAESSEDRPIIDAADGGMKLRYDTLTFAFVIGHAEVHFIWRNEVVATVTLPRNFDAGDSVTLNGLEGFVKIEVHRA